jgi:hypothetical protein
MYWLLQLGALSDMAGKAVSGTARVLYEGGWGTGLAATAALLFFVRFYGTETLWDLGRLSRAIGHAFLKVASFFFSSSEELERLFAKRPEHQQQIIIDRKRDEKHGRLVVTIACAMFAVLFIGGHMMPSESVKQVKEEKLVAPSGASFAERYSLEYLGRGDAGLDNPKLAPSEPVPLPRPRPSHKGR